jgi:hypothetical protein
VDAVVTVCEQAGLARVVARLWPVGVVKGQVPPCAADHRILPYTANLALEAWAPGKGECIAEWRRRFRRGRVRGRLI